MNKLTLAVVALLPAGIGLVLNFIILRTVMRKLHKPQDRQQQTRLAAMLAVLLSAPSVVRIGQLAELMEAQPLERRASRSLQRQTSAT